MASAWPQKVLKRNHNQIFSLSGDLGSPAWPQWVLTSFFRVHEVIKSIIFLLVIELSGYCNAHHCVCRSHRLSAPSPRQPRCFLASPPWKTSMGCRSPFLKPASVSGQNCARCTAWTCPTRPWTVAAASCPGAWPPHHAFVFPPAWTQWLHAVFFHSQLKSHIWYIRLLLEYMSQKSQRFRK